MYLLAHGPVVVARASTEHALRIRLPLDPRGAFFHQAIEVGRGFGIGLRHSTYERKRIEQGLLVKNART